MSLLDGLAYPDWVQNAQNLLDLAQRAGVKPRVTSVFRTYAQQNALYQAYIKGTARYPAAPPGSSAHEYGYAFDMVVEGTTNQADVGTVWRSWGGIYGGEEDPVHFQFPGFNSQTAAVAAGAPQLPPGFGTAGTTAQQAADLLLAVLPTPLRGIVGTAGLASAIVSLAGGSVNLLLWWVSHPVEFVRDVYAEWWTLLKLLYG